VETQRCLDRDLTRWGLGPWTEDKSLSRFRDLVSELENTKFSEAKPFTAYSVPWPILGDPAGFVLHEIEWSLVDKFFDCIRLRIPFTDYKDLLHKVHLMFHPDRWKSRGYLTTVQNEETRKALESAGNIISQAVMPLWKKTKA
jgi:hypothetical protein